MIKKNGTFVMDVPKATNLHLCHCNFSWKFNSRKLFETAYKHEKNSHSNAKEFKLRIHINYDLHWYGSRHATFCKVFFRKILSHSKINWPLVLPYKYDKKEPKYLSIDIDLHWYGSRHATFCKVGQKPPGGNSGV